MDDGLNNGQWRNAMLIDPLKKYGGYSYHDIMIKPIADALAAAMAPNTKVWFALQGEMSAMVTKYPKQHHALLGHVKDLLTAKAPERWANVRVGVSTNFNKLCGMEMCQAGDAKNPAVYDAAALRDLYNATDFIGMSAYPRFKGALADMEDSAQMFDAELRVRL